MIIHIVGMARVWADPTFARALCRWSPFPGTRDRWVGVMNASSATCPECLSVRAAAALREPGRARPRRRTPEKGGR